MAGNAFLGGEQTDQDMFAANVVVAAAECFLGGLASKACLVSAVNRRWPSTRWVGGGIEATSSAAGFVRFDLERVEDGEPEIASLVDQADQHVFGIHEVMRHLA